MTGTGGMFQQSQVVNEQQDFSNGLKTITATEAADNPFSRIAGDRFPPSQVCSGGNSRKSSETMSGSMISPWDPGVINHRSFAPGQGVRYIICTPGLRSGDRAR